MAEEEGVRYVLQFRFNANQRWQQAAGSAGDVEGAYRIRSYYPRMRRQAQSRIVRVTTEEVEGTWRGPEMTGAVTEQQQMALALLEAEANKLQAVGPDEYPRGYYRNLACEHLGHPLCGTDDSDSGPDTVERCWCGENSKEREQ